MKEKPAMIYLEWCVTEEDILDIKDNEVIYHDGLFMVMLGIVRKNSVGCKVRVIAKKVGNRIEFFEEPETKMLSIYAKVQKINLRIEEHAREQRHARF